MEFSLLSITICLVNNKSVDSDTTNGTNNSMKHVDIVISDGKYIFTSFYQSIIIT